MTAVLPLTYLCLNHVFTNRSMVRALHITNYAQACVWYTLDLFFSSFSSFIQLVHNLANSDSTGSLKERLLSVISSSSPPLIVQKLAAMIAVSKGTLCQLTQTCNLAQPISDILLNSLFTGPFHIFISFPQTQLQQSMSSETAIEIVLSFWLDTFFSIPSWIRSTDD